MQTQREEKREFYSRLRRIVIPIACQNFLYAAVSAVDAIMLWGVGQTSLSAVSLASQISFVLSLFYSALTSGATILAAQYWGKGDIKAVEKVLGLSMRYSIIISLFFTMVNACCPSAIMHVFTSDQEIIEIGAGYLRVVSVSYIFMGMAQVYLCIMKNCDKVLLSTIIGGGAVAVNVVLNIFLIFGIGIFPRLEAKGAALATDIAMGLMFVAILVVILTKRCVALRMKYLFGKVGDIRKDFNKHSLTVLGNQLAWGGGITMYSVIMGHLGNDATAANSIATIGRNLCASLCWGIGTGAGILVGNKLGRNDMEGAKRAGSRLCRIALITGVLSGIVLLALTPFIVHIADLTEVAKGYLVWMLVINSYYIIGNSINSTVIAGIFYAGGDSKFGLICDLINMWGIIIPCGFLAAFVFKVPVIAVSVILSMDEFTKLPVIYHQYKKYKWIRNLTR